MNRRYSPDRPARAVAFLAAVAVNAAVLAGLQAEAGSSRPAAPIVAAFTGEVTAAGPVYRLPRIEVVEARPFELALPGIIDRTLARFAGGGKAAAKPSA